MDNFSLVRKGAGGGGGEISAWHLKACSQGGGGSREGEVPHVRPRSEKPGLHMQPWGPGVWFKMLLHGR